MKKPLSVLILTLLLCTALAACGSSANSTAQQAEAPAAAATEIPATPEPTASPVPAYTLRITELMSSNSGFITDGCSAFPDWVELYNYGSAPVDLAGFVLQTAEAAGEISGGTVQPGGYLTVWCGSSVAETRCHISLKKDGGTLTLLTPWGAEADSLSYPACSKNHSLTVPDGALEECGYPTPGFENSSDGYAAYCGSLVKTGIAINEAVTCNTTLPAEDGEYYDWVELKNYGSATVSLTGLYLSDDSAQPALYPLEGSLAPGEVTVVFLQDDAGFSLSNQGDKLFLSDAAGNLLDNVYLRGLPAGYSYGRQIDGSGFAYFASPTPGADNGSGPLMVAATPSADTPQGVYEAVSGLSVALSAPGTVYYTLDGSAPTMDSPVYTDPIPVTQTTVIRAMNTETGKLNSEVLTLSYIVNEGHSLPVTSLVVDPGEMFGSGGIYRNPTWDVEIPATVSFFEEEDSFTIDCGVKLHGATSRVAQSKKSMKLCFRGRYDGDLEYDLFGNGITDFSSVLLRSAQEDVYSTQMRDILFHELAQQCTDALPTQDYKYTILYINGEYWGIYAYREAYSAKMYADHYGYDTDSVTQYKESWSGNETITSLYYYMMNHDMADPEAYAYVVAHLDVENLIAWTIIQSYAGNLDINPPNMRFFYSEEDGILRYALVDLDLSSFTYKGFESSLHTGYIYSHFPRLLLRNAEFKQLMAQRLSEYLHGPLSDANVTAMIDMLAAQLRDEIPRDANRWCNYTLATWERGLQGDLYRLAAESYHHARVFASSASSYMGLSRDEQLALFGDLP